MGKELGLGLGLGSTSGNGLGLASGARLGVVLDAYRSEGSSQSTQPCWSSFSSLGRKNGYSAAWCTFLGGAGWVRLG